MTYITSTVPELSGLCYSNGVLYGVSDDLKNTQSGIYTIDPSDGTTTLFVSIDADLEGITCDPEGNLYVCTEDELNADLTHKTWGLDAVGSHTSTILKITLDKTVSILGYYTNDSSEQNKGLEGIAYYDTVDGEPRLLIGNLKNPIVLALWSLSQGIISLLTLQSKDDVTETSEIGDLYYDGEYLYILDSKTAIVYKYTINYTTKLSLALVSKKILSDTIDMSETLNDGDGENPEALTFIGTDMLVGCDYNSKIYTFATEAEVDPEEPVIPSEPIEELPEEVLPLTIPQSLNGIISLRINNFIITKAYFNKFLVYLLNTDNPITTDSVIATGVWLNDSLWSNDDLYSNN